MNEPSTQTLIDTIRHTIKDGRQDGSSSSAILGQIESLLAGVETFSEHIDRVSRCGVCGDLIERVAGIHGPSWRHIQPTGHVAQPGDVPSVEDAPQRGTDAAEQHEPKPDTVEGHGHQRNGDWHDEPPAVAADLVFTSSSEHDGKLRRWWVDGPNGVVLFEVAEAGLVARTVYLHSRTRDLGLGYEDCAVCGRGSHDTLVGAIARQLHQAFDAEGESAIREQLEHWYGEFLAGGEA